MCSLCISNSYPGSKQVRTTSYDSVLTKANIVHSAKRNNIDIAVSCVLTSISHSFLGGLADQRAELVQSSKL